MIFPFAEPVFSVQIMHIGNNFFSVHFLNLYNYLTQNILNRVFISFFVLIRYIILFFNLFKGILSNNDILMYKIVIYSKVTFWEE